MNVNSTLVGDRALRTDSSCDGIYGMDPTLHSLLAALV